MRPDFGTRSLQIFSAAFLLNFRLYASIFVRLDGPLECLLDRCRSICILLVHGACDVSLSTHTCMHIPMQTSSKHTFRRQMPAAGAAFRRKERGLDQSFATTQISTRIWRYKSYRPFILFDCVLNGFSTCLCLCMCLHVVHAYPYRHAYLLVCDAYPYPHTCMNMCMCMLPKACISFCVPLILFCTASLQLVGLYGLDSCTYQPYMPTWCNHNSMYEHLAVQLYQSGYQNSCEIRKYDVWMHMAGGSGCS